MSTRTTVLALALVVSSASAQQLVYEPAEFVEGFTDAANVVVVADLDGDGLDDLVDAPVFTGLIRVGISNGDGTFTVSTFPGRGSPFALVDADGDGALDLVHATPAPTTIGLSRGLGDGTFADPVPTLTGGELIPSLTTLAAGDVNGDGHADLAYTYGFLGALRAVALGQGDGTFTPIDPFPSSPFSFVEIGDVDGDGFDDVVLESLGVSWFRSVGDGTFDAPVEAPPGSVFDVLGDGAVEFVAIEGEGSAVDIVVAGWVGGAFEELARVPVPFAVVEPSPWATDVDGDGETDLVLLSEQLGHVFRQSSGVFELAASFTTPLDLNRWATAAQIVPGDTRDLVFRATFSGVSVARDVTYADDEPFTDLGGNTPGSVGFPTQVLAADGTDLSVRVLAAAPSTPIFAIWGGSLGAPIATSATSPSFDRVLGPFTTSPLGTVEVSAIDALPLGLDVFTQWWVVDPEAGFASTSTVRIDAP